MGSMLHHRFPNGFTNVLMDETDREVSTLTDRAFRSLCIGDDAAYNDDFLYRYSPFNCHKPLAGEPKRTRRKESKKQGQNVADKSFAQHQESLSNMSSFLKALSATEESCKGMLIKNGDMANSKGESWDKSALRSIQRELSEFSPDFRSLKDAGFPSEKSSKKKNGKSTAKLRKLNIRNFFFHSEFSPFQTWRDLNRFPFGPGCTVLPEDNIPTWYDMRFYKELTEAHREDSLPGKEEQSCQNVTADPPPSIAENSTTPSPPLEVSKQPTATLAEKSSSSDGADGNSAPWRHNRLRAKSVIPNSQTEIMPQKNGSELVDDSLPFIKNEVQSMEVKTVEEVSSSASTPFSICQLMTPIIPSRQPTETSEILQSILSPSIHDLLIRPHSEAKLTPEVPVKRDSYKSLASSILFNLKDNRKRVKSRYSPHKFKTSELSGADSQSPKSDHLKLAPASTEAHVFGLSTSALPKDGQTVCSPTLESTCTPTDGLTKDDTERQLLDDYLLSNLLQSKREAANNSGVDENISISPFIQSNTQNAKMQKQDYPSLYLYKKDIQDNSEMKNPQVSQQHEPNGFLNKVISPKVQRKSTGISPNILKVNNKDILPSISEESLDPAARKIPPNSPDKAKQSAKDNREASSGEQRDSQDSHGQLRSTRDVVRVAKEAIYVAKGEALSAIQAGTINVSGQGEVRGRESDRRMALSSRKESSAQENSQRYSANGETLVGKDLRKEPPPVPKKRFTSSDIHHSPDQNQEHNAEKLPNCNCSEGKLDLPPAEDKCVQKPDKGKRIFSSRQNSYIKSQRYLLVGDENREHLDVGDQKVDRRTERDQERLLPGEMRDSGHIIHDLNALKELEEARLRDHFKLGHVNLDEEAKAKNDLISRELKSIKKGMLSMRGNTLAKRDLFASKEREHAFPKIDNNAARNKVLINKNYDKAKMALVHFMSEREKKKDLLAASDESHLQSQGKNSLSTEDEKLSASSHLLKDLKERLGNVRDHNHMRQILGQLEPGFSETSATGGVGKNSNLKTALIADAKPDEDDAVDPSYESEDTQGGINLLQEHGENKREAPPVPPRSKRAGNRRDSLEVDSVKSVLVMKVLDGEGHLAECTGKNLETQAAKRSTDESVFYKNATDPDKERCEVEDETKSQFRTSAELKQDLSFPSKCPLSESETEKQFYSDDENKAKVLHADTVETSLKKANESTQVACSLKKNAPFLPGQFTASDNIVRKNLVTEEPVTVNVEGTFVDVEDSREAPRDVISPLLSLNGTAISQNPPDQSSQSSKSSYFSVESALYRNTEPDVYHSLENLTGGAEFAEDAGNMPENTKTVLDRYFLGDPEIQSEDTKVDITIKPEKDKEVRQEASTRGKAKPPGQGGVTASPLTTFSPPLGFPALFKIKDNTMINKRNATHPWSPKGSLSGSERREEEKHRCKENPDQPLTDQPVATESTGTLEDTFRAEESSSNALPVPLQTPQGERCGRFLTVPQEEDRFSGVSPSSAVESLTTSTADTSDETGLHLGLSKVPSERSASTCSGNDSQTGLPKPPAVLPKSEKAVLRALKLTHKRMKKEVQRSTHKSAQSNSSSSSRHPEGHPGDKTEHKSSKAKNSSSRSGGQESGRKNTDVSQNHSKSVNKNTGEEGENPADEKRGCIETEKRTRTNTDHKTRRRSAELVEGSSQARETLPRSASERRGRSANRQVRDKQQQRHYSTDRVISNVPVYKAHANQRDTPDRTLRRSQSIDRCLAEEAEHRRSTDMAGDEKTDPRTRRIEKSLMEGFQQRGRSRDKVGRGLPLRRSHSIDTYSGHGAHPSTLSHQSSHAGQLSRQSSTEHAIVAQSFPVTQRKLLQDPDSGQYFVVDMPIQVKTKTFFDPETGSYVQLPVQPPEGAVPQASALEVLTSPVVVYHSFVPVPLSPMAQNDSIRTVHTAPQELEQRDTEKSQQSPRKDKQTYSEPVYAQNDHTFGEFVGTEELDCPS